MSAPTDSASQDASRQSPSSPILQPCCERRSEVTASSIRNNTLASQPVASAIIELARPRSNPPAGAGCHLRVSFTAGVPSTYFRNAPRTGRKFEPAVSTLCAKRRHYIADAITSLAHQLPLS